MWFFDGAATTIDLGGFEEDASFEAGSWSTQDIQQVDAALRALHMKTNNDALLQRDFNFDLDVGFELWFFRYGQQIDGPAVNAVNGGNGIKLFQSAFDNGQASLMQTVFHEVGHNWDTENPYWSDFQAISGWVQSDTKPSPNHVQGSNEQRGESDQQGWSQITPVMDDPVVLPAITSPTAGRPGTDGSLPGRDRHLSAPGHTRSPDGADEAHPAVDQLFASADLQDDILYRPQAPRRSTEQRWAAL